MLWSGHVVIYTGHYSNQPSSEAEQGKKINEVNISGRSDCRETLVTQRGRILVVYLIALTNEPLFVIVTIIIIFLTGKRLLHFNNASSCTRVPSSSVFCGTFSLQCYCVVLFSCLIVSTCSTFHQEMFIHMIMFFLHDFTLKLPVPLFQRVTPRKYSTLSQELYVFHRWGLIE